MLMLRVKFKQDGEQVSGVMVSSDVQDYILVRVVEEKVGKLVRVPYDAVEDSAFEEIKAGDK